VQEDADLVSRLLRQACTPRPTQERLSESLDRWARSRKPVAAIQADTGVGKTRVLLAAAQALALGGARVTISVSTIVLARQVVDEARRFDWRGLRVGRRLGIRSFISASRVSMIEGRLIAQGKEVAAADLRRLRAFAHDDTGLIEDWIERFGELPAGVAPDDIALLPSARKADKARYLDARVDSTALDISIQTHALTLMQARAGSVAPVLIFDEADTLAGVADGAEDRRLSLGQLSALLQEIGAPGESVEALARLRGTPEDLGARERLADLLALRDDDEAVRLELSDARRVLKAHKLDGPRRGTQVDRRDGDVVIRSLWASRAYWTWKNLRDAGCQRAIFASATLALGGDPASGLRTLGVDPKDVEGIAVSPQRFGDMRFRIAERNGVVPPKPGQPQDAWREAASQFVAPALAAGRRALLLTTSFDDARWLGERFGIRAQQRGEKLQPLTEAMRTFEVAALASPSAWVGVDLPGVLTDLVIWRLPFEAPDELRDTLAGEQSFQASLDRMLRRLRQGFGRGVRQMTDEVLVWVADPRVHDGRLRVISAVPERFRTAWNSALSGHPELAARELRPEQRQFRQRVLEADGFRCVITGCTTVEALDAAHKPGRDWRLGHNGAGDGWTLRSDLHRLLDAGEVRIEDDVVWVSPRSREHYGQWHGARLAPRGP
jgi:Rad3-related DNA helicase